LNQEIDSLQVSDYETAPSHLFSYHDFHEILQVIFFCC